jgi:hypothetical protein
MDRFDPARRETPRQPILGGTAGVFAAPAAEPPPR